MAVNFLDKDGLGKVIAKLRSEIAAKVPNTRTINNKALSSNISLTASDVGAAATSHTHDDRYFTETEVVNKLAGKVDTTRTINGKALSSDISLTADDLNVISVPACTASDNGKVLMVVNGVPTWTSIPSANGVSF